MAGGLTLKQKRALRNAPKRRRAALARSFRGRRAAPRRRMNNDASMLRGIKQGVGRSLAHSYGGVSMTRAHPCCHDAFHYAHLPLPRAVGPYSIVRTTQVLQSPKTATVFGPFYDHGNGRWTDVAGLTFNDENATVGNAANVNVINFDSIKNNGSWTGAQCTPSAFSVQIMNPNPLQSTSGIVYIGRIRTSLKWSENLGTTVKAKMMEFINYNGPRLCSAAKLALRGVQVDLVPYNMSELANFTPLEDPTWTQYGSNSPNPYGFAPLLVYNPQGVDLQYLICAEWRVRFDPSNPAQATHQLHPPASESVWAQIQHRAEALGNGVVDIAERVANTGQAVYNAAGSVYGAIRGVRALRGAAQLALTM